MDKPLPRHAARSNLLFRKSVGSNPTGVSILLIVLRSLQYMSFVRNLKVINVLSFQILSPFYIN